MIRIDYLFSYWIFIWSVLYILKLVSFNPKFALTIALLENVIKICTMIYYKIPWDKIVFFCIAIFFVKVLPLWSLRNYPYTKSQFMYTIVAFVMYSVYLHVNGKSVYSLFKQSYDDVKHNKFVGPLNYFLYKKLKSNN